MFQDTPRLYLLPISIPNLLFFSFDKCSRQDYKLGVISDGIWEPAYEHRLAHGLLYGKEILKSARLPRDHSEQAFDLQEASTAPTCSLLLRTIPDYCLCVACEELRTHPKRNEVVSSFIGRSAEAMWSANTRKSHCIPVQLLSVKGV